MIHTTNELYQVMARAVDKIQWTQMSRELVERAYLMWNAPQGMLLHAAVAPTKPA